MLRNKSRWIALVVSVFCLSLQGSVVLAIDSSSSNDSQLDNLTQQTRVLAAKLQRVQRQVATLRRAQSANPFINQVIAKGQSFVTALHPFFIIGTPVISSPYIGINSEFNASDLVVNQPYVNEDLYLLQQRRDISNYLTQNCIPFSDTPVVNLSGKIESQLFKTDHFGNFRNNSAAEIDLTGIELDTEILVNRWVTGLIAFVYDNSPPMSAATSLRLIDNSNVFLERGFLTVGNLAYLPVYGTIGQFYVPFGDYSSDMVSSSFPRILGRTKARAIEFGYSQKFDCGRSTLNLATFAFRGPSRTSIDNNGLRNYGANAEYIFTQSKWKIDVAGSYIRSIADALGMQHNGNSGIGNFLGFAASNETEILNPVSGLDARANLSMGAFSVLGEYVTTTRSFSQSVLSFNGRGAKPEAFHTEAAYRFNVYERPSAFILGYDQSTDALGFLVPKTRYAVTVSTSIWKDTIESLEFRHDIDYSATDQAIGQGLAPINGTGESGNTITFQIGLYF